MDNIMTEQILQLRKQGIGYKTIAKKLKLSLDTVRYHCRKNGLGGFIADNPVDNAFSMFLTNIKKNHGNECEYVSGYIGSDKPVIIKCKKCNHQFKKNAQFARHNKKLQCPNCIKIHAFKRVKVKKVNQRKIVLKHAIKIKPCLKEIKINECAECGSLFGSNRKLKYCSAKCKRRSKNRIDHLRELRIRTNGKVDRSITLEKLIRKEKNVCYLCGGQCDSNDFIIDDRGSFIVGRNYPSIEHVIPVSKGGTHSWDNVKLAHHYCNTIKNDKMIVEDTGQMVFMF